MKKSRGYVLAIHITGWLIFLSLPALFITWEGRTKFADLLSPPALYFIIYFIIFYLHTHFLFPKLYFGKKYFLYFLCMALLTVSVFHLRPFDELAGVNRAHRKSSGAGNEFPSGPGPQNHLQPPPGHFNSENIPAASPGPPSNKILSRNPKLDIISMILFILVIAVSITILVTKRWRIALEEAARAEADKANAELSFLKAQIHPHFLFNTLNNIYSLALMKDEHTAESILKLSNIMRYVTDDAKENFVSLQDETNFISDYIALQQLRLGAKTLVEFVTEGNLENKVIAPLVLITFIENVFKYGTSNNESSVISINLKADDHSINFSCRNKLFPSKRQVERTGIGIANTKKRLDHLYSGRYLLNIKEDAEFYSVHLVLQL